MLPFFTAGPFRLELYGLLVVFGAALGILWLWVERPRGKAPGETPGQFWALIYSLVLGGLAGGKIGFLVVEWRDFLAEPREMLSSWKIGWVFWTSLGGAMLAGWAFQRVFNRGRREKRRYLPLADYLIVALPMGHVFGRLGCFAQGCCHGRPTALPWGVTFSHPGCSVSEGLMGVPLHPTQLYEAAGELALLLFLLYYVLPNIERKRFTHGTSFLGYIFLYSLMRFVIEFFRGDDRGVFLWPALSPSQWFSSAGLLVAGVLLWRRGVSERQPDTRSVYY
ncbi:MAG: prolipoprotein diacylglyceryl transferase [Elusimicrobiota bacterium]